MGKIVLLDDSTINKIAAGEVIERPASVVKEVMENSIDAGATSITVEIRNGGISYIRVTDNGKGIMKDDLEIAFERHATSKLRHADELNGIKSMGFRGEALASIASIAKVTLTSKTENADTGYELIIEGGNILEKTEAGCPKGTSITIENLFYNTPVRYKFLKKDFTEAGYIEDVVTRIALVHPEISIRLINTGKTIIQTSGTGEIKPVVYNIYGKEIAENLIDIDYTYEDIVVKGVIGKPVISRSNRTNQLFFVNNRFVKDKTLSGAAEQAFKGFVTIGRHGFLVLNIDMNPEKVDVNVHPAKLEVRFQEESKIFKAVYHAIKEGLLKGDLVANTESIDEIDKEKTRYSEEEIKQNPTIEKINNTNFRDILNNKEENTCNINEKENEEIKKEELKNEKTFENVMIKLQKMQNAIEKVNQVERNVENEIEEKIPEDEKKNIDYENVSQEAKEDFDTENIDKKEEKNNDENFLKMYEETFGIAVKKKEIEEDNNLNIKEEFKPITQENKISVFEDKTKYSIAPVYKLLGIAFNTYIIIEMQSELYIIDQHAAHERIMYEKIKENYYSNEERNSQLMLLPDIITLTHKEMGIYKDNRELFRRAGFDIEEFGENTLKLSGVPDILLDLQTKDLFLETLDEINTVARTAKQEIEERFIATVACKAAVKAHMVLAREEVTELMDSLLKLPNPFTCPHGRPTAIRMTKKDIEKKFSRIQ